MGRDSEEQMPYQAAESDYANTGFDRGHLNPASYHCDNARHATYTLTNAVPQDPCFNQQIWKLMEQTARKLMRDSCNFAGARRFFVTGSVPQHNRLIPKAEQDAESEIVRPSHRVSIPSHMWTAACCDSSKTTDPANTNKGFSFAYIGANTPAPDATAVGVNALEQKLTKLYRTAKSPKIFKDGCLKDPRESIDALNQMQGVIQEKLENIWSEVPFMKPETLPPRKRPRPNPLFFKKYSNAV